MNNNSLPQDAADKQRELPLTYGSYEEQGKASMRNLERSNNILIEATVTPTIRRVDKLIRN